MRLYPLVLLVARIVLASSAGTFLTFNGKGEVQPQLEQANVVTESSGAWIDSQCEWRERLSSERDKKMSMGTIDDVFYACIVLSGIVVFVIFNCRPCTSEKEISMSVFECLGILKELQDHREDLVNQMKTIAGNNPALLKQTLGSNNSYDPEGNSFEFKRLKEQLVRKLKKEDFCQSPGAEALLFFLELRKREEYLHVKQRGFIFTVLSIIALCQTIFPVYLAMDGWLDFYCATLGSVPIVKEISSIWRGIAKTVLVLVVFARIIRSHVQKVFYASKHRYNIPVNRWTIVGDSVSCFSTGIAAIAANTIIWVPDSLLGIVGSALICFAIYHLNEIIVYAVISKPDSFQQWSNQMHEWLKACPLELADLVNDSAESDDNLFVIETGEESGRLLKFHSGPRSDGSAHSESETRECETRLKVDFDSTCEIKKVVRLSAGLKVDQTFPTSNCRYFYMFVDYAPFVIFALACIPSVWAIVHALD